MEEDIIAKYSGKRISTTHELFASVIDLNTAHEDIIRENKGHTSLEELKKSVLLTLIFTVEIAWPKNNDMIQMMEYSEYRQDGKPNSLSDIPNTAKN